VIEGLGGATAFVTNCWRHHPAGFADLAFSERAVAPGDACCVDGGMSI